MQCATFTSFPAFGTCSWFYCGVCLAYAVFGMIQKKTCDNVTHIHDVCHLSVKWRWIAISTENDHVLCWCIPSHFARDTLEFHVLPHLHARNYLRIKHSIVSNIRLWSTVIFPRLELLSNLRSSVISFTAREHTWCITDYNNIVLGKSSSHQPKKGSIHFKSAYLCCVRSAGS